VTLDRGVAAIGHSTRAVDAFRYIVERARELGLPVAINLSRGTNGGGHAGETALELALDDLARLPDVAIVKSAGNEQEWQIHAGGRLVPHDTREIPFRVTANNLEDDVIEVWFDDRDEVSVAVQPPSGPATGFVRAETKRRFMMRSGNAISIDLDRDANDTADTRATLVLSRGTAARIEKGTWKLLLKSGRLEAGRYDAWIERALGLRQRHHEQTRFVEDALARERTITIPGTARNVITVGSYVTRTVRDRGTGARVGELSTTSSHGPTRYGHLKPDLVAPGEVVWAARAGSQRLWAQFGTSIAAPAVAGVAALLMSRKRGFRNYQLKQILTRSARRDGAAVGAPNERWGYGKLDAARALKMALEARFPAVSEPTVNGARISWRTDIPSTGKIQLSPDRQHLQLGKNVEALAAHSRRGGHSHGVDLSAIPPGTYFCEIIASGPRDFFTEDDNDGEYYEVRVPMRGQRTRRR
jgi:subtilisin family serine protease